MTPEQFERWKDFATRMARACYGDPRKRSGATVLARVEQFLQEPIIVERLADIRSWDQGNDVYVCDLFSEYEESWMPNIHQGMRWRARRQAHALHDRLCAERGMTSFNDAWYDLWHAIEAEMEAALDSDEWHGLVRQVEDRWVDAVVRPVRVCVRAGLDMASEPSMGVVGFTVGDLRKMYPEGLPDWVALGWGDDGAGDIRTAQDADGVWL